MNIQAANLLSALSGSEALGHIQQGLLGGAGEQGGFASALMEQLGLLQSGGNPDMSALQSLMDDVAANGGLQDFAALFGKNLPAAANKSAQDIDLEDTLQTLAEVMQQLQQLETEANAQQTALIDTENQQVLADLRQAEQDADAPANYGMPISVPVGAEEALAQMSDSSASADIFADAKKPAALAGQTVKTQNVAANADGQADAVAAEFDRGISAMIAKQGAEAKPQQDQAGPELKSAPDSARLGNAADGQELKASPSGIAGDIARMTGAVRNQTATPLPSSQTAMQKPFGDPGWQQELGDKLIWMHKQDMPSVQLRLNPEHLGPILVKIDVNQDQASVAFTAQHLSVKEAIEAAIPKLREMLSGQQLNLADVNVSQQQSEQRQSGRDFFQMAGDRSRREGADGELPGGAVNESQDIVDEIEAGRAIAANGLLSLFA